MFVIYLIIIIATLAYLYCRQRHNYWQSRGVHVPSYWPFLGHFYQLLVGAHRWEYVDKIYKKNKQNKMWGMYEVVAPRLYVGDPTLIRDILVKDADHFMDRRSFTLTGKAKVFSEMLTILKGEKWKALRSIVTPTFTSGKIKGMFKLIDCKADELVKKCQKDMSIDGYIEIRKLIGFYTMDVIATCAFGIESQCLQRGETEFSIHAAKLSVFNIWQIIASMLVFIAPSLFKNVANFGNDQSISFLEEAVLHTVKVRKESGNKRGDFLDIILEALEENKENENSKYPMTIQTVVSESILFLLAGFDTTANTISFVMYLLAKNTECQNLLRDELNKILDSDGELNYKNIMEAKYLDACFSESLRLYAPAHVLERLCTRSYKFSDSNLEIPEGILVDIPVWSLHYDELYWSEPKKFKPERFIPENKDKIIPYTYMPFGLGPRNCVGMRFAQLESKLAIAKLCLNFEITLQPGYKELALDKSPNTLRPDSNGIKLIVNKL